MQGLNRCLRHSNWQAAKPTKPSIIGKNAVNMEFSALVI
jgi:hypothetical protein